MKQNIDLFFKFIEHKNINYKKILKNKNNFFQNTNCDISVILETKGDRKALLKCLSYLRHSIAQSMLNVGIVIVECNTLPTLRLYSIENQASYIFIKADNFELIDEFSSAISYNAGGLVNPSAKYLVFHDVNILLPHDFFCKFQNYIERDINWFENFFDLHLYLISRDTGKKIITSHKIFNLYQLPGSALLYSPYFGLSLTVKRDYFLKIGGFDPELNLSKPLENEFLKIKLLCLEKEINNITDINYEKKIKEIPLTSFLLKNDFKVKRNVASQNIFDLFCDVNYNEKMRYIEFKSSKLS